MWKLSCTGVMLQSSVGPRLLVCVTMSRKDLFLQERGEGSLNTSSSGLATGMKAGGTMAYQADAEGEGSGSDPAGNRAHQSPIFFALCPITHHRDF